MTQRGILMICKMIGIGAENEQRGSSSSPSAGQSFFDDFDATNKGVPKNWMQFSGLAADFNEMSRDLTLTDASGDSGGIYSTLPSSVFNPATVATTIQAQVKGSRTPRSPSRSCRSGRSRTTTTARSC
jgi:hypothetical protein